MFIINPFYDHITLSRCKDTYYFPHHQTFPHFFHQQPVITPLSFAQPRPRHTNTRTSCVKQSQFYCVKQSQFYCVKHSHIVHKTLATLLRKNTRTSCIKQSQFYCVKQSQFYCVKYSRATPTGRELVCEYKTAGLPVKSSLLRMGGFRRERWSLS